MDARAVIVEVLKRWRTQDVETTFELCADDVVYVLYVSEDAVPFGGVTQGRDAMMSVFYTFIEQFDYLKYEPLIVGVDGDVVRVQTQFQYHHRRTGEDLTGSMRTVFTVRDGLVVRCEEYVDRGLVESFMRLARQREADNEIVAPPALPQRRSSPNEERPTRMEVATSDEDAGK
jgi:ketosteroid isomerase-like protein